MDLEYNLEEYLEKIKDIEKIENYFFDFLKNTVKIDTLFNDKLHKIEIKKMDMCDGWVVNDSYISDNGEIRKKSCLLIHKNSTSLHMGGYNVNNGVYTQQYINNEMKSFFKRLHRKIKIHNLV